MASKYVHACSWLILDDSSNKFKKTKILPYNSKYILWMKMLKQIVCNFWKNWKTEIILYV